MDKGLYPGLSGGQFKGLRRGNVKGLVKGLYSSTTRFNNVDVFLSIGDSIGAGLISHTASTLPPQGDAFEYDFYTKTVRQFGIQPTNFNNKSPWAKFCIEYKKQTSRRALIINQGSAGATISPATSIQIGNDWQTSGLNYYPTVAAVKDCLFRVGKKKLTSIMVVLGTNDIQGGNGTGSLTVAQVGGYMTNLIDSLRKDFGTDVPILISQPGVYVGEAVSTRMVGIRNQWKVKCQAYDNVHMAASLTSFGAAGLLDDGIHPSNVGNDALGAMFARWFKNARYTKWARSIISSHVDEITDAYKKKIDDWMRVWQTQYLSFDMMFMTKTNTRANTFFDWSFLCSPTSDLLFDFTADSDIRTDGTTSKLFDVGYNQIETAINVLINDYGLEIKLLSVATSVGSNGSAIGNITTGTTKATFLRQVATGINWACLDTTSYTYTGVTGLTGASYFVIRTASNANSLWINGVSVSSQTGTASIAVAGDWKAGAHLQNAVLTTPIDAKFQRKILFVPSTVSDKAAFVTDLDTLQS